MGFLGISDFFQDSLKTIVSPFQSLGSGLGQGAASLGQGVGKIAGDVGGSIGGVFKLLSNPIVIIGGLIAAVVIVPKLLDR